MHYCRVNLITGHNATFELELYLWESRVTACTGPPLSKTCLSKTYPQSRVTAPEIWTDNPDHLVLICCQIPPGYYLVVWWGKIMVDNLQFFCRQMFSFNPLKAGVWELCHTQTDTNLLYNYYINTPGTAGGPGGRDRTLAVKSRKNVRKITFFS